MYLKDEQITINIGGVLFTSYSTGDPQFVLDQDAIAGWYDGPSSRRTSTARANGWGDFPEKAQQGSRVITLTGTARASSITDLGHLRDILVGLFADGTYQEMSVETNSGIRYATVGIEGTPSWIRQGDTFAVFKLDLYAPDPRIYGKERRIPLGGGIPALGMSYPIRYPLYYGNTTDTGTAVIGNAGNTEAWPKFVAQGSMPYGFVLHNNNGRQVSYLGQVTVQAPVIIDMHKGTATQNGIDKTTLINIRNWFSIPALGSISPGFEPHRNGIMPVSAAWCDIIYRDTWI